MISILALTFGFNDKFCKIENRACSTLIREKAQYTMCHQSQCNEKYGYKCDESICSTTRKHCDDFIKNYQLMKTVNVLSLEKITRNLKDCPKLIHLKTSDICLSEKKCFLRQNSLFRDEFGVTPIQCACPVKLGFRCQSNFCTVSSVTCDSFIYGKKAANFRLNSCNNNRNITKINKQYLGFSRF